MADPNPKSLVTDGTIVSTTNPLPATVATAGAGTDISVNPISLVVNGAAVSADNPLPLILS